MSDTSHHEADHGPGLLSNAIAIIAFIIVIAIVIWGLLHLANISTSWFSSLFPRSNPTVQISAPAAAESGTPITVSWKHSAKEEGAIAFLYQCRTGVSVFDADGARVLCGVVHPLMNATSSSLTFTPVLSGVSSTTLPFSIIFVPASTSSKQVQGTATIALNTASGETGGPIENPTQPIVNTAATRPTPVTEYGVTSETSAAPSRAISGTPANLSVRIVQVIPGDLTTVQFDVANTGGTASGSYTFTAYLPTAQGYVYASPAQVSLGAGDHVLNTLQFSESVGGQITIVVQPGKSGDRASDNTASYDITAPYAATPRYDTYYDTSYYNPSYPQYQYSSYDYYQYPEYQQGYTYDQYYQYPDYPQYDYGYQQYYQPYDTYYPAYDYGYGGQYWY